MSFGAIGFGGSRLLPQPQTFQALSLGGVAPVAPAPPFGTPNQDLVPVERGAAGSVPANLTIAAQPVFAAILQVNPTVVGVAGAPVGSVPNSTAGVGALNPAVNHEVIDASSGTSPATAAQAPVSFALTAVPAYLTSGVDALPQALPSVQPANPALVARLTHTVQQLAVSSVYGGPVFSFLA